VDDAGSPLMLQPGPMGLKRGRCRKSIDGPDRLWYHVMNIKT